MTRARRTAKPAMLIATLAVVAAACGGDGSGGGDLTGRITADGSSTVFPITQAVAEEFNREQSGVQVSVGTSGTGGGFEKFCNGETDLSNASRPIRDSEKEACAAKNVEYLELRIAIDGLSVLVNPENDWVECLTLDELKRVWEPNSAVRNWSQVRSGFPSRPLTLYGPGTDSGTFDYFTDAVVGEEGASRSDYTASEDDNVLVRGVGGDPNALGYFGFAYYAQNQGTLKAVAVDGGEGCVEPTEETINSGRYAPLSRPLFVYVATRSASRPEVRAFVDFYLDNVGALVADVGYIPLPEDALVQERAEWDALTA